MNVILRRTYPWRSGWSMALRPEEKREIEILRTDGYGVYGKYSIAKRHVTTKSETAPVESKNSLPRPHLARFNRKTRRRSRAFSMIRDAVMPLFSQHLIPISTFG